MKLDRRALIAEITQVCSLPAAHGKAVLEAALEAMVRSLRQGERIELRGFGVFTVRSRIARRWRNPKSGVLEQSNRRRAVRFRAARDMLRLVNGAGSAS